MPALLKALGPLDTSLPFERTAGDEVQGLMASPAALTDLLELVLRGEGWNVGLGFGAVEEPPPASVRAGRGAAYLRARSAVTAAKSSPWRLRVEGDLDDPRPRQLETVLWLWAGVLSRRSAKGWEVADLVMGGSTYEEVGRTLGITPSAVSQRAQAAGVAEGRRTRELVAQLIADIFGGSSLP
ncbi:MAG: transposase [Nocardioides sp.]